MAKPGQTNTKILAYTDFLSPKESTSHYCCQRIAEEGTVSCSLCNVPWNAYYFAYPPCDKNPKGEIRFLPGTGHMAADIEVIEAEDKFSEHMCNKIMFAVSPEIEI